MFPTMLRSLPTGFIAPCLPTKADTLPSGGQWLHETKHDGFRVIARKEGDPKLEVIIRTRGGASIYSWTFGFSVRCADTNRPLPPLSQVVPNDIAANLFNSVGTVEISEYREPTSPILTARQCPS
jgi:hypothetical protein